MFKHLLIFTAININQIKRKRLSLPLLLLFPIMLISLAAFVIISLFSTDENAPIQVGLVDLDQSKETTMLTEWLADASQLGSYLHLQHMTEDEAQQQIAENRMSAYIVFPKRFTANLYAGNAVNLEIKGNPSQPIESMAVKELLDSLARHIRSAQANILTINEYARKLEISSNERQDFLFEQFVEFFLYALGKDKIVQQKKLENIATSSPKPYFLLSGWFILITIWAFLLNVFFYQANAMAMQERLSLYGVKRSHQLFARIIVAFSVTAILAAGAFFLFETMSGIQLPLENKWRISAILCLYLLSLLLSYAILETLIRSEKLQLFVQLLFTGIFLLSSGAIIPSLYFSLHLQKWFAASFSYEAFHWLQEIALNGRFYADFLPLLKMGLASFAILIAGLAIKERVQQ